MLISMLLFALEIYKSNSQNLYKLDRLYILEGFQIMNFKCKSIHNKQAYIYVETDDVCIIELNNTFIQVLNHDIIYSLRCYEQIKLNSSSRFTIIQNYISSQIIDLWNLRPIYIKSAGPIFYNFNINTETDFSIELKRVQFYNSYFQILLSQEYQPNFNNILQFYNVRENIYVIDLIPGNYNCIIIGSSNLRYQLYTAKRDMESGYILNQQGQINQFSQDNMNNFYLYVLRGEFEIYCEPGDSITLEPHLNHWYIVDGICPILSKQYGSFLYYEIQAKQKSEFINIISLIIPPYLDNTQFMFKFDGNQNQQLRINYIQYDHCNLGINIFFLSCNVSKEIKIVQLYVTQQQYLLERESVLMVYLKGNQFLQSINVIDSNYILKLIIGKCTYSKQDTQIKINITENTIILLYYLIAESKTKLLLFNQVHKIVNIDYTQFNNPKNENLIIYIYPNNLDYTLNNVFNYDTTVGKDRQIVCSNIIIVNFYSSTTYYILMGDPLQGEIYTQQVFTFFYPNKMFCYQMQYQFSFRNFQEYNNLQVREIELFTNKSKISLARNAQSKCFTPENIKIWTTFLRRDIIGIQFFQDLYLPITDQYYFIFCQENQLILKIKSSSSISLLMNVQSQDSIEFVDYPDDSYPNESDLNFSSSQFQLVDLKQFDCLEIDCILKIYIYSIDQNDLITYQTCQDLISFQSKITKFNDTLYFCSTLEPYNLLIIDGIVEQLFNNTFLVCNSISCAIYISLNIYSDDTILIMQKHGIHINLNQLNVFNPSEKSVFILYINKEQTIQIQSNTTFTLRRCGLQIEQEYTIHLQNKLDIDKGFYCTNPLDSLFYITIFTFHSLLYESIEFYNQGINEWQFINSEKIYAVIQFKISSQTIIFQYLKIHESFKQSGNLVLKLNDHKLALINGSALFKVKYTDFPCYVIENTATHHYKTDKIQLQITLNNECSPKEINIHQGKYTYQPQISLLIQQELLSGLEHDIIIKSNISILYQVTTFELVYEYIQNLEIHETDSQPYHLIDLLIFLILIITIWIIIMIQQKQQTKLIEISRFRQQSQ